MKDDSMEKLKQLIADSYRKHGSEKTISLLFSPKLSYTGDEIADEIEKETELGIRIINSTIQLTIDLLSREKIKMSV